MVVHLEIWHCKYWVPERYWVLYRDGWGVIGVCVLPGLRGGLCLSFLWPRTISVVFCGGTGIYTDWMGMGALEGIPWDRMGLMGLGTIV